MRIGFEAKRATHNFRGLGNYSRGLIDGLIEYSPSEELFLYSPPIEDTRGQRWVDSLSGKANLRLPKGKIENKLSSFWRSFLMAADLKKDKLDIFHGLSHEIPYGLKGDMPFKKVVTMHDLIFIRYPDFFPLIDRIVYLKKFKYACENSDLVIAICEQTKEDLIKYLGIKEQKIKVHYQSCSPAFYKSKTQLEIDKIADKYKLSKSFILNVGAFEERKNQLNLLEAFAQAATKIEQDLVFIGQGKKYKDNVIARINELKLNQRVHVLDSVGFEDLPAIYQAASVFCFPSLFEGFGIPIVEALFSKTPVITSYGSCFPESAGPDSYYVDPLSPESIAQGLSQVLESQSLREQMIERGLEFVQRFHQKETTSNLIKIYQQL
jgi:glycosyltransferase involved in cell wall biosynthesis